MKKRILLSSPHMSEKEYEQKYVKEAFDTNWIAPLGNNVDQFEKEFVKFLEYVPFIVEFEQHRKTIKQPQFLSWIVKFVVYD
jgi:hypothetical protein